MLCLSLWCHCMRVSGFKSWLTPSQCSTHLSIPPPPPVVWSILFPSSAEWGWILCLHHTYFLSKSPKPVQQALTHTHIHSGASLFHGTHRLSALYIISIPHSYTLTGLDLFTNPYAFCQYLKPSASLLQTCACALTHTVTFQSLSDCPESTALKWHWFSLSQFQSLILSLPLVLIPPHVLPWRMGCSVGVLYGLRGCCMLYV